ncbi:hypothetical protein CTZ27_29515 [Streptomyces griseocarneus]|nr:hypothetical protein CTZ27_29515 [Streptomyces griseocarneus]
MIVSGENVPTRRREPPSDPAERWTGYRAGALVVDKTNGRVGVSTAFDGEQYTLRWSKGDPPEWTAPKNAVRLATNKERAALGLSPRRVD